MLDRIDTSEVEKRFKHAQDKFSAFKLNITKAIGEYESSWYFQWYLDGKTVEDALKLSSCHSRVRNVYQLKDIIEKSTHATQLADDLTDYIDGDNDHFSWAWFSPLRDYVRDAVEDYAYTDLQSYDADMKLFLNGNKTELTASSTETTFNDDGPIGPGFAKQSQDALAYHQLTIKYAKSNKENRELKEQVWQQEETIKEQESLIASLRDIISELLIQITTFKQVARSVVGTFGDILDQIGNYFNLKSAREIEQQKFDPLLDTPHTPISESATLNTPDRIGKNWQNALPLWLGENGVHYLEQFENAEYDLDCAVYTADGVTLKAPDVFNPHMTYEYLSYRVGMEDTLTEQVQAKEEFEKDLETAEGRLQELESENEQLRKDLEQARLQLAQQASSSAPGEQTEPSNAAPPPPPVAPPPPAAKIDTTTRPRFFKKRTQTPVSTDDQQNTDTADQGLAPPSGIGAKNPPSSALPKPILTDQTNAPTEFKDELELKLRARAEKGITRFTPERKQYAGAHFLVNSEAMKTMVNRFKATHGQSPLKGAYGESPAKGKVLESSAKPEGEDNSTTNTSSQDPNCTF